VLTDEQITKFQGLYKERFGQEIGRGEAMEKAARLLRLMELVYQPLTEADAELVRKRRGKIG